MFGCVSPMDDGAEDSDDTTPALGAPPAADGDELSGLEHRRSLSYPGDLDWIARHAAAGFTTPTEAPSPIVACCTIAPAPTCEPAPIVLPTTTARSPTDESSPTTTGASSPRSRLAYHTDDDGPSVTAPTRFALGATKLASSAEGDLPAAFTSVVGMGTAAGRRGW